MKANNESNRGRTQGLAELTSGVGSLSLGLDCLLFAGTQISAGTSPELRRSTLCTRCSGVERAQSEPEWELIPDSTPPTAAFAPRLLAHAAERRRNCLWPAASWKQLLHLLSPEHTDCASCPLCRASSRLTGAKSQAPRLCRLGTVHPRGPSLGQPRVDGVQRSRRPSLTCHGRPGAQLPRASGFQKALCRCGVLVRERGRSHPYQASSRLVCGPLAGELRKPSRTTFTSCWTSGWRI